MTQPLFPGNQTNNLNWFTGERLEEMPKIQAWHAIGYATIPSGLQTSIDIFVPSNRRDSNDLPLIVPAGSQVYYIGLRTPKDVALIGTTGERLKVATAHTDVNPAIVVASNVIAANSTARSGATPFDTLAAPLGILGGATQYRLLCSNAGNTAAGTGIRVATGTQRVIVDLCYLTLGEPSRIEQVGYPSSY
jgi:hypothetical protein